MDINVQSTSYLPKIHFTSTSTVVIDRSPEAIFEHLETIDFTKARVSNFLFKIRGINIPKGNRLNKDSSIRFYKIHAQPHQLFYLGLIGKFWTINGDLQKFDPKYFRAFKSKTHAKAIWEFKLIELDKNKSKLVLNTQLYAPTKRIYKKLNRYWYFAKPMSYLVKLEILFAFKNQVLQYTK